MKTILLLITTSLASLFLLETPTTNITNNCSAELTVTNNWSFRSAYPEKGTRFFLELKNTSETTATYQLSSSFLKTSCANKQNKTAKPNTTVGVSFIGNTLKRDSNEITLQSGQVFKFEVAIDNPKGTPVKAWSCIEVNVNSKACKASLAKTTLSVYLADPADGY